MASKATLQVSDGYRAARRTTSILCALSLAWSTAQFDLKNITLGFAGSIDLSRASLPLILLCAIVYTTARCMLEFSMQCVEVRRWLPAQADIKLSLFLVQVTILILAASGLNRSVDTVLYVVAAALIVLVGSSIATFVGTIALMPVFMYIRSRQGRNSVASRAAEASAWAELFILFALIAMLVALGFASLYYPPVRSLWTVPPSPLALGLFVLACISIVICVYFESMWHRKLFASPSTYTKELMPDGTVGITFVNNPPPIWDWYSHSTDDEECLSRRKSTIDETSDEG